MIQRILTSIRKFFSLAEFADEWAQHERRKNWSQKKRMPPSVKSL